jgi:hypothetical protein
MAENNNKKSTDDSINTKDLNKQTSEGSEADQLKGSDADQDNDGAASLNNKDISDQNAEEDSTPLYDLESQDPDDHDED